ILIKRGKARPEDRQSDQAAEKRIAYRLTRFQGFQAGAVVNGAPTTFPRATKRNEGLHGALSAKRLGPGAHGRTRYRLHWKALPGRCQQSSRFSVVFPFAVRHVVKRISRARRTNPHKKTSGCRLGFLAVTGQAVGISLVHPLVCGTRVEK